MTKKPRKTPRPTRIPGTTHINIQIPTHLHKAMKAIQQKRRKSEYMEVTLCKLYREAIQLYVTAEAQQRLLNGEEALRHSA